MKHKIKLSIALILSIVLVSLTSPNWAVQAQNNLRPVADTGVIKIGPGQQLRVTVAAGDVNNDNVRVRIVTLGYSEGDCTAAGVCLLSMSSQATSPQMTLGQGEALAVDGNDFLVWQRMRVLSSRPNMRINAIVFDTSTQRVVSIVPLQNIE
jgi:hypothetical protein